MKTRKLDEHRKKMFSKHGHNSLKAYEHESMRPKSEESTVEHKVERTEHEHKMKKAMHHPDVLGAGAKKRKELHGKDKIAVNMREMKRGTLRSGSGAKVTNPKQALAISFSEMGESKKKKHKK